MALGDRDSRLLSFAPFFDVSMNVLKVFVKSNPTNRNVDDFFQIVMQM